MRLLCHKRKKNDQAMLLFLATEIYSPSVELGK